MASRYSNFADDVWLPMIPGTQVSRREVCQQIVDAYYETDVEEKRALVRRLALWEVLTGGQVATLLGVSRQAAYTWQLRWQATNPRHAVRGLINPAASNNLLRAVLAREENQEVTEPVMAKLKEFGTRAIVFHLTGVDYASNRRK